MDEPRGFNEAKEAAEKLVREKEKLERMLEEAVTKARQQRQKIAGFWDDLRTLIQMLRSYFNNEYTQLPWKTIVFAVAAILYFLNPFDLIPDFLPSVGFLDDATVVAFVVNALREDLERFRRFRQGEVVVEVSGE